MKSKILIILLLIGAVFVGCYDDKGNYNLLDNNQIKEATLNRALSNTSVYLGDTMRLVVDLQFKYPDRDTLTGFEYVWKEN